MTHVRTSPNYPQSNGKLERWHKSLKSECIRPGDAAVAGRCKTPDSTVCGPIQLSPAAQRDRLRDAEGHARRASAGDSSRAGSEVGRGEGTAEESPPAGGMDETDCSRLADNAELTQRQGQAYVQRSESPRSPEESLYLGTRAAVEGSPSVRQSAAH